MKAPARWTQKSLSDYIVLQRGFDLPLRNRVSGPFKVLSSGEASGWHNEGPVKGPGFVVGRATNIGRPTWSDEDYWPLNTVLYAKDFMGNDPKFAYYWFLWTDLTAYNSGSVQPMLNRNYIANVPILVPPIDEQRGIAATLGALDDKIESNRRVRQLAGELLQTLFKFFFVTFERWGGNAPANWREGRLGDVLFSVKATTKPGAEITRPYVPIDMMPTKSLGLEDFRPNGEAQSSLLLFEKNDILIGAMRVYFHRVSLAPFAGITRTTSFVLRPFDDIYLDFALLLCNEEDTISYAEGTSKGSTMPYAVWESGLADMPTLIPPPDVASDFSQLVRPLVERIREGLFEQRTLTRIRDALLPELLSGRIRVPEAREAVQEVIA